MQTQPNTTSLPQDMWDKIVDQLPPSKPKLVPMIYCRFVKDENMVGTTPQMCLHITEAVHEEEYDFLTGFLGRQLGLHMGGDNTNQHHCLHFDYHTLEQYECFEEYFIVQALGFGWDFASTEDRRAYDSRKKSFRLTRKA
jgi:hypothetical protein